MTTPCALRFTLVIAALALAAPAIAEPESSPDTARAKDLFARAEVQFGMGQFRAALALYQQAYQLRPLPGFHFNIGQCHRNLGDHKLALFHYRRYLALQPGSANRDVVEELILDCQKAEREKEAREQLQRRAAPTIRREVAARPAIGPAAQPRREATAARSRRRLPPVYFWSGVGATAALLIAGTVTGSLALARNREYNDPSTPIDRGDELRSSGQRLQAASTATFALGGAAAIGTAVLFWLTDFRSRSEQVAAAPLPDGGALLFAEGRF